MHKRTRTIIVILLFLSFFTSAPVVLLYTQGYSYNFSKHKMEKTGILRIESRPSNATIHINDTLQKETTPTSFFRLLPEDYRVRVEKEGYIPWKKTLEVVSGQTTFARNIYLLRDSLPQLLYRIDARHGAFNSDGSVMAFLRYTGDWIELGHYNKNTNEETLLARFSGETYTDVAISWSPNDTYLLLSALESGNKVRVLYGLSKDSTTVALHTLFPPDIRSLQWSPDESILTAMTRSGAYAFNPDDKSISPLSFSPSLLDIYITNAKRYTLRSVGEVTVLESAPINKPSETTEITRLPSGTYIFQKILDGYIVITEVLEQKSILINEQQKQIVTTIPAHNISLPYNAANFDAALLWNDFEIYTLDISTGTKNLITRIGSTLIDVRPFPASDRILYATDSAIHIIDLDDRDNHMTYDILQFSSVGGVSITSDEKTLLFVGAVGNQRGVYERQL